VAEALTSEQFYDSPGVEEWRIAANAASCTFVTGTFARGVDLVDVIGSLADAANHHPDVDLRCSFVTVRLTTHDIHALSDLDAALARQISVAAHGLGIVTDDATARPDRTDAEG
jgi:4a-hydroxytetrahydrobiopterin dehydratase